MKKVLVFYSFKSHKTGYIEMLFERLSRVAAAKDIELVRGSLKDLVIQVKNGAMTITESLSGEKLENFDAVYFELWYKAQPQALCAARYLAHKNIPFFSQELGDLIPMTKVGELAYLAESGVPIPQSFTSSRRQTLQAFKQSPPIDYPLIVKAEDGYGGKNNFLIGDYESLSACLQEHPDKTFVIQQFIPNDFDYRCIVLGGTIRVVLKRQRSGGGHLNNTSQGAEGTIVPLSDLTNEMQKDVLLAAESMGRSSFAGVDLLVSNNGQGHFILEVNQTPQIEIGSHIDVKMNTLTDYLKEIAS